MSVTENQLKYAELQESGRVYSEEAPKACGEIFLRMEQVRLRLGLSINEWAPIIGTSPASYFQYASGNRPRNSFNSLSIAITFCLLFGFDLELARSHVVADTEVNEVTSELASLIESLPVEVLEEMLDVPATSKKLSSKEHRIWAHMKSRVVKIVDDKSLPE